METCELNLLQFVSGLILAIILAAVSFKFRALSVSGAIGTIIVGTIVFGLGGWQFSIPLLFFFISSNILSKLKSDIKLRSLKTIEKAGPRDIWQVCANGGVASLCVVFAVITGDQRWFFFYLASLGVATADTWGTEIGTLLSARPISIVTFKFVSPGISGGMSILGTIASLLGSCANVFAAYPFAVNDSDIFIWIYASIFGFIGSLIDSLLGASAQAAYKCESCHSIIEVEYHCGNKAILTRGFKFINNDMVNFLSNLIAVVFLAIIIFQF